MNRETAIAHFQRFGAACGQRHYGGRNYIGIQLRNSAVTDSDLAMLEYVADEVDVIGLEGTRVTDEGLEHLLQLTVLDNVDLTNTAITDAGLETLCKVPTMEFIHVEQTKVTPQGIERTRQALPTCSVCSDYDSH